jgi:hypothetical protein
VGNFEHPAHGLPTNADDWASAIGDDGTRIAFVMSWVRRAGNNYLFILGADADAWANHYFLSNEMCFPKILEPIKQHLKNHKNTNNSYLNI